MDPLTQDAPGTLREYEALVVLRSGTSQDDIRSVNAHIRSVIEQMGGRLLKVDSWGKRRLADELRGQLKGLYLYWLYLGSSDTGEELERRLRRIDAVIRYYTVRVDSDVDPASKGAGVDDEAFNKAATSVPDEEELVKGAARLPGFEDEEALDDSFLPSLNEDLPSPAPSKNER